MPGAAPIPALRLSLRRELIAKGSGCLSKSKDVNVRLAILLIAASSLWAQSGLVRIRVTDPKGSRIAHATVSRMDLWNQILEKRSASKGGEVLWKRISLGDSQFLVEAPGFYPIRLTIQVRSASEQTVEGRLQVIPQVCLKAVTIPPPDGCPFSFLTEIETIRVPPPQTLDDPQPKPAKPKR